MNKVIKNHFLNPKNLGTLEKYDILVSRVNPVCGDQIQLYIVIDSLKKIKNVKYMSYGCSTFIGTSSFLSDYLLGKVVDEVELENFLGEIGDFDVKELHVVDIFTNIFTELHEYR